MSARLLFEVALRVLGIWLLVNSVNTLILTASSHLASQSNSMVPGWENYLVAYAMTFVVQSVLGVVLLYFAPNIAALFYQAVIENDATNDPSIRIGPGDVYHIACFVLGAYLLVQTAEPASQLVIAAIRETPWMRGQLASTSVRLVAYAVSGIFLVFGSRSISRLLSNLRYDPETIFNQQVSIAMLLILLVVIAVVLAILRRMT